MTAATVDRFVPAVRIALAELYPAQVLSCIRPGENRRLFFPGGKVAKEHMIMSIRLAVMHLDGPEGRLPCDKHAVTNRPDLWAQCEKVTVRDALMGHLCGAP